METDKEEEKEMVWDEGKEEGRRGPSKPRKVTTLLVFSSQATASHPMVSAANGRTLRARASALPSLRRNPEPVVE